MKKVLFIMIVMLFWGNIQAQSKKELEAEKEMLLQQLEQAQNHINTLQLDSAQKSEDYQMLQQQYADLEEKNQKLLIEKNTTSQSLDDVLLQYSNLQQSYDELIQNSGKELESCNKMREEYEKNKKALAEALQTINELEDEIMDKDDDLLFLQEQISRLRQKYED